MSAQPIEPRMKLTCYALTDNPLPLRAAPPSRDWMDRIPDRHAYRCLPLAIANAHGWEVACVCDLEVDVGRRPARTQRADCARSTGSATSRSSS